MTIELFDESEDDLQDDVERRLNELKANPEEALKRFDRNGDGILDHDEWRAARAVVRRELQREAPTETLKGRYRVVAPIGRGAHGTTSLAVDEKSGDFVAIKELDFANVASWDAVALFDREAAVLGGLAHPAIPRYVDSFHVDDRRHFLAQEFVDGANLQMRLEDGSIFDEATLHRYATDLIEILVYLHGHSPPVLHRDIKPANVIERPDGSLALVDFGAAHSDHKQETIIGTSGYMSPEQLMGRADPTSDLYALGATLVHLATARHPTQLQQPDLTLDWQRYANLSPDFARWLDRMVAPMPEDRFSSALLARAALQKCIERAAESKTALTRAPSTQMVTVSSPFGSPIAISTSPERMELTLSPETVSPLVTVAISGATFIVAFSYWLFTADWERAVLFGLAGLVSLVGLFASSSAVERVTGDHRGLRLERAGNKPDKILLMHDVQGPEVVVTQKNRFTVRVRTHSKGTHLLRTFSKQEEAEWLSAVLREWLIQRRMESQR